MFLTLKCNSVIKKKIYQNSFRVKIVARKIAIKCPVLIAETNLRQILNNWKFNIIFLFQRFVIFISDFDPKEWGLKMVSNSEIRTDNLSKARLLS